MKYKIAIDVMSGDIGPSATLGGSLLFLSKVKDTKLHFFGDKNAIEAALIKLLKNSNFKKISSDSWQITNTTEVVAMDELPQKALRFKKDSSMRVALNSVKNNQNNACVSAGNTGALIATAKFVLKTINGIERPAICTAMPTLIPNKPVYMLDLGANIGATSNQIAQFAWMGSLLFERVLKIKKPKIGLLNIGQEETKGLERNQLAREEIKKYEVNYQGFAEGTDIFSGEFDVIACDGYDGNIALKTAEGTAEMISLILKTEFKRNIINRFLALLTYGILQNVKKSIDPRKYNGASLIGLNKVVIKSHGGADAYSFSRAIFEARSEIANKVPERIAKKIKKYK